MKNRTNKTSSENIPLINNPRLQQYAAIAAIIGTFICILAFINDVLSSNKPDSKWNPSSPSVYANNRYALMGVDTTRKLIDAQNGIMVGDYERALNIYMYDELSDNPIALCNLGYMFGYGKGVKQDTEKGIDFLQKAYGLGSRKASINILGILLNSHGTSLSIDSKDTIKCILTDGIKNNDAIIQKYIIECLEIDTADLSIDLINEETLNALFTEAYETTAQSSQLPSNTPFNRYEYVTSSMVLENDHTRMICTYKVYKIAPKHLDVLDIGFEFI